MRSQKKKYLIVAVLFFGLMTVVVSVLGVYNSNVTQDLRSLTCNTMAQLAAQQQLTLSTKANSNMVLLKNLSKTVVHIPKDAADASAVLPELASDSGCDYMLLIDGDGNAYSSNGGVFDVSNYIFFREAICGNSILTAPTSSLHSPNENVFYVSAPIYIDGAISGVLAGACSFDFFNMVSFPVSNHDGRVLLCNKDGTVMLDSDTRDSSLQGDAAPITSLSFLIDANILEYDNYTAILSNVSNNLSGHSIFSTNGENVLMHYMPLGLNDWYIFVLNPESTILASVGSISNKSAMLTVFVFICFILLTVYICWLQGKSDGEKAEYTKNLERIAYYDELTSLPNLYQFKKLYADMIAQGYYEHLYLLKFDILNFKAVNEMYGFDNGNLVLTAITDTVQSLKLDRKFDKLILARLNADEFLLLNIYSGSTEDINEYTALFEALLRERLNPVFSGYRIDFRYGRYFTSSNETDVDSAIEKVNFAHRTAKLQKTTNYYNYEDGLRQRFLRNLELESKMEASLLNDEFKVYLQPKYDLLTECVVGAEALARWATPDGIVIMPSEFIPLFEKNGFIIKLDLYMYENVCRLISQWLSNGDNAVPISINFSRMHLTDKDFVSRLDSIAKRYHVPRKYIEIELTESVFFENEQVLQELLFDLHNAGFTLSMDDFGTGYSSLGLLKNLPVDIIKIDRSFFTNNKYKTRAKWVIESIMQMAKKLDMKTVAEGVESEEHIALLRDVGCDIVQGFYYSRPVSIEDFPSISFAPFVAAPSDSPLDILSIGDVLLGRGEFGDDMPVSVFRLFQYSLRLELTRRYGNGEIIDTLKECGTTSGRVFARTYLNLSLPFNEFTVHLTQILHEFKIGNLEVEIISSDGSFMVFVIKNDLDCSGLADTAQTFCQYDEGFIAGILHEYTGKLYLVNEVDCWGNGADLCRFEIRQKQ